MAILSCIRPVDRPALAIATNRPDVPSRRAHMPQTSRSLLPRSGRPDSAIVLRSDPAANGCERREREVFAFDALGNRHGH